MHGLQNDAEIEIRDLYVFVQYGHCKPISVTRKVHNRKLSWWSAQSVWKKESSFHFCFADFCLFSYLLPLLVYLLTYLRIYLLLWWRHRSTEYPYWSHIAVDVNNGSIEMAGLLLPYYYYYYYYYDIIFCKQTIIDINKFCAHNTRYPLGGGCFGCKKMEVYKG